MFVGHERGSSPPSWRSVACQTADLLEQVHLNNKNMIVENLPLVFLVLRPYLTNVGLA